MFMRSLNLRFFLVCLLAVLAGSFRTELRAQSYSTQFETLFLTEHPDTTKIKSLLRMWQHFDPDDPQLYVAAFNFYFAQSSRELATAAGLPKDANLEGDSSRSWTQYDPKKTKVAMDWMDQGIKRFPDRLDMYLGKAHALRLTHSFDSFLALMPRILNRSVENRNQWKWSDGNVMDSGRRLMLTTMQGYMRELYRTDRKELLPVMSQLGASIVKIYPEEVEVLSMTAVSLLLQQQHAQAIAYLKRAEHIRPRDVVVLNNLAEAYRLSGDKEASLRYLRLVELNGSPEQRSTARRQMKALRKE